MTLYDMEWLKEQLATRERQIEEFKTRNELNRERINRVETILQEITLKHADIDDILHQIRQEK